MFNLLVNSDRTVSFKSITFSSIFLHLDVTGVATGHYLPSGGGIVNAQFTACSSKQFKIHRNPDPLGTYQGIVGIESAAFPGRYLRLDGSTGVVNVQGVFKKYKEFRILVVGL